MLQKQKTVNRNFKEETGMEKTERREQLLHPRAVIGTNSWGSGAYEKAMRGCAVGMDGFRETMDEAKKDGIVIFDTARDYGNGKCPKILGEIATDEICLSSKYTPFRRYRKGQVFESVAKDLADFKRSYIDIYWLHMPNDIEENLKEIIELYRQGKIRHIGVSNFNLNECRETKRILDAEGIPLYGVQNHYSILCRDWEKNGLVDWCHKNGVLFWAWSSLEGGLLAGPVKISGIMGMFGRGKAKKFAPLYEVMEKIGKDHNLTISQVAMSYCVTKQIVPMCGCRRKKRVAELAEAVKTYLTEDEIRAIERVTEEHKMKNLGSDVFRFAVRKK